MVGDNMDIRFTSLDELKSRLMPALRLRKRELRKQNPTVTEEDIWIYFASNYWKNASNLSLAKMVNDILNASQTAKVIGCSAQRVRERLKRGIWDFGTVVKAKQSGKTQDSYEVNKYKLAKFLEIPVEEIDRRLSA